MILFLLMGGVFFVSFSLTDLLIRSDFTRRFLDYPNDRSLHTCPTPRIGGIAILAGIVLGIGFGILAGKIDRPIGWMAFSFLFLGMVSFLDDRLGLPLGVRLTAHICAALMITVGTGLKIQIGWATLPITLLFIIWMTNLYNFMDGMDGFCGGMTALGFGWLGLLAWITGHSSLAFQSAVVAAAASGFLVHNLPPARIFMGDVGSIPLGFLAAVLSLEAVNQGVCDASVPLLIFSPFIVDATTTLLRRIVSKKKFWLAHREHYYQRVALAGWGHLRTVRAEYRLMIASGLSALVYAEVSPLSLWRPAILIGWVAIYLIIAYRVRRLEKGYKS